MAWLLGLAANGVTTLAAVIPIHYDSLTGPIEGPFRGPVMAMAFLSSGLENTLPFLRDKARENPEIIFQTLPRYDQIVLFR